MIKLREVDGQRYLETKPHGRPKRITGTRFSSILGLDNWNSEFSRWCEITKTYEEPFIDNKYTLAGKAIEPILVEYLKEEYLLDIITPEDVYGENHFQKTWGNFYPNVKTFGGMWDGKLYEDGKFTGILEIKTSSRPQDWSNGAPDNYALQASLYAYLSGVRSVTMAVAFLQPNDYLFPEEYEPDKERIHVETFDIYEKYPDFEDKIKYAMNWWKKHVETGISPIIATNKDQEILNILMTDNLVIEQGEDYSEVERAYELYEKIEKIKEELNPLEKEYKDIRESLKNKAIAQMRNDDNVNKLEYKHNDLQWTISKGERKVLDKKKLQRDVDIDKYTTTEQTYTIRQKRLD